MSYDELFGWALLLLFGSVFTGLFLGQILRLSRRGGPK